MILSRLVAVFPFTCCEVNVDVYAQPKFSPESLSEEGRGSPI